MARLPNELELTRLEHLAQLPCGLCRRDCIKLTLNNVAWNGCNALHLVPQLCAIEHGVVQEQMTLKLLLTQQLVILIIIMVLLILKT